MEDTTVTQEETPVVQEAVPEAVPESSNEATPVEPVMAEPDKEPDVIEQVQTLVQEVKEKSEAKSYFVHTDQRITSSVTTQNDVGVWTSHILLENGFLISADAHTAKEAYMAAYDKFITAEDYLGYVRRRSGW